MKLEPRPSMRSPQKPTPPRRKQTWSVACPGVGREVDGREYSRRPMSDRWATFDCYGTLIDWEGGLRDAFASLWPEADHGRLLRLYQTVEPRVQEPGELTYRQVLARCLAAVSA